MRLALALILPALLCAQKPTDAEATELIEKARSHALAYTASLPDFLCTQTIRRVQDPRGDNRWQEIDRLTVRLSYSDRQEDYKLTEINGKPTVLDYANTGGPSSRGEFGSLLLYLFHPKVEAQFHFKNWATIRKQRVAVFAYKVDKEHSLSHVIYGPAVEGPNNIITPYYGEVAVKADTGEILRLTHHAVIPVGFPITASSTVVEYGSSEVGGRDYILPQSAEISMASGRYKTVNYVDFKDYRKFQTEAVISFDK